ncbi:MAG: 2-oxo acid dehydrogenase subunit E2, partial [Alphaproteobacteria bacterium]
MPIPVLMPALSPTMTEGNLARWLKSEGDSISPGDVIAEIETDKATMEFESVDEGTLGKILVAEGTEEVAVNTPIAVILEEGEDASALDGFNAGSAPAAPAKAEETPKAEPPPVARTAAKPSLASVGAPAGVDDSRVIASPLARRLAAQQGIDLATVTGTGPHGRIVKADIESYAGASKAPATAARSASSAPVMEGEAEYEIVRPSNMRKVIAERMTASKQQVPHFYLTVDVRMDKLASLRAQLIAGLEKSGGKISVTDVVGKASAAALKAVPEVNASW